MKDTPLQLVTFYNDLLQDAIKVQDKLEEVKRTLNNPDYLTNASDEEKQFVKYMLSLDTDTLNFVVGRMSANKAADEAGVARPLLSGGCNCSGAGNTPNGYWDCFNAKCVWIPEIGA